MTGVAIACWMRREATERVSPEAIACRPRAERGDVKAQEKLASMYYHGRGTPKDYGKAVRWYRKAARQGDAVAEQSLGYMYATGRGVPRSRREAVR